MTSRKKTNLKIIGATAVGLFSLTTLFTGTLAWFNVNQTVSATGMNISVKLIETELASLTVHRCDLSNSTSTLLKFNSTPSVVVGGHGNIIEASGVQMDNYSTLNQTQPVLLLFTFSEGTYEDDLTVSATTPNASFVSSLTTENVSHFPFSSAVKFKSLTYSTNNFPFNNVNLVDANENPVYTSSSFVELSRSGDNVTVDKYNSSLVLFDGSNHNHTAITHLAIILDYYAEAIEYISGHTPNYAPVVLTNNNVIDYFCDWSLEM